MKLPPSPVIGRYPETSTIPVVNICQMAEPEIEIGGRKFISLVDLSVVQLATREDACSTKLCLFSMLYIASGYPHPLHAGVCSNLYVHKQTLRFALGKMTYMKTHT